MFLVPLRGFNKQFEPGKISLIGTEVSFEDSAARSYLTFQSVQDTFSLMRITHNRLA